VTHFAAVVLFAFFASIVFGITQRETPRRMIRYGNLLLCAFRGFGDCAQLGNVFDRAIRLPLRNP